MTLRTHLALSYLAVILIGMGIVIPLAWLAVERLYLNTQSTNLLAQAQLVAAAISGEITASNSTVPYTQTANALPGIHTRVINAQNAVVIDLQSSEGISPSDGLAMPQLAQNAAGLVTPEELLSRSEIAQAQQGKPATAIRRVEAAGGRRVLYAAAPVLAGDGSVTQIVYLATPLPDTQWGAIPAAVRWQIAAVLLAAMLLAGAAGFILARRISLPISRLVAGAHAVANGNLSQAVPEDANIQELAVLGSTFNRMTASLRQSDQAKTAFISDVSHELRTPLTVIKGTIETLQDGAVDDRKARDRFLSSMNHETERLIRLVNDLLVLTRADAGALNLQLHPLDLAELARSRCEQLEAAAGKRQVQLRVADDQPTTLEDAFMVMADADRAAQVIDNLLNNAIRYAPEGSEVTVTLNHEGSHVACQVADRGPGIPAEHLPLIFERFYRADTARGRGDGGSGLGLAIVRSLVLAQGGRVSASSTVGQGTTVTFWLPAAEETPTSGA
jgi:signal transduction histidine kinase